MTWKERLELDKQFLSNVTAEKEQEIQDVIICEWCGKPIKREEDMKQGILNAYYHKWCYEYMKDMLNESSNDNTLFDEELEELEL